jgi:tetratricopeptide (TPR) repeat protein
MEVHLVQTEPLRVDDVYAKYREALRLGHQLASEGKFDDALRRYQEAAELAGDRALPHLAMGGMLMRLRKPKDALASYDRALEREPEDIDALSGRAAALLATGRRDDAAKAHQRIDELRNSLRTPGAPAGEDTPLSAADVFQMGGQQAFEKGMIDTAVDAWLQESREHAREDHLDAAMDACLRAVSVAPGSPRIHLELVRLYLKRGWTVQAVERALLLDRLLGLDPDDSVSAELRGLAAENASVDERLAGLAGSNESAPQPG